MKNVVSGSHDVISHVGAETSLCDKVDRSSEELAQHVLQLDHTEEALGDGEVRDQIHVGRYRILAARGGSEDA